LISIKYQPGPGTDNRNIVFRRAPEVAVRILCSDEVCTECCGIISRAYAELRLAGCEDRDAFASAIRVLELRHPGHDKKHYRDLAAEWIAVDPCG
jgi:hypothetical protein